MQKSGKSGRTSGGSGGSSRCVGCASDGSGNGDERDRLWQFVYMTTLIRCDWAGAVRPPCGGGQGCEPLCRGSKAPLWWARRGEGQEDQIKMIKNGKIIKY